LIHDDEFDDVIVMLHHYQVQALMWNVVMLVGYVEMRDQVMLHQVILYDHEGMEYQVDDLGMINVLNLILLLTLQLMDHLHLMMMNQKSPMVVEEVV
jgi:hypothetical protein